MSKHLRAFAFIFTIAALLAVFGPQTARADADDPPSRVARLSYIHGNLSFQPAGTDDWATVALNRPVTTGDKIWADNDSRAELHIGSASLRLSSNTGFSFFNLSDNVTQIRLTQGTLRIRIKRLDENETFEVDTPNLAFSALRPGIYRINVNEGGDTTIVKVREGQGEVTGGGSAYNIRAHEVGNFTGTDQISADVESFGNDDDDFDHWCGDRDRHEDTSVSARYVSRDVIGYEDLDDYGGWRPVSGYGTVWFPHTTIVGWAPYHYGHWAYVYPWGYTWVDDAPWGFAPFHYGRWIFVSGVWGWVPAPPPAPGVVYVRPVYAPALVAWVGGPHFSIGVSIGGGAAAVGWFPLGPREVYVPTYHVSQNYVQNVNVSNTTVNNTVVNNYYNNVVVNKNTTVINQTTYVNQTVPGAVAATTPQAFSSAQSVSKNTVSVNARDAASAPVSVASPTAAPSRQAVMGAGAAAQVRPSAESLNRPVVAKVQPPPPPVSFARQQQAFTANGGKPPAMAQVRQMQAANVQQQVHPTVKIAPPSQPATPRNVQSGGNQPGSNQPGQRQQGLSNSPGNNPGNNRPPATAGQAQPSAANQPGNAGGNGNTSRRTFEDRPPSARPNQGNAGATGNVSVNPNSANSGTNSALDQKHQQELQQLRAKQDQERQKVEQQQVQERQRLAQQNADQQKQRDLNQKHQQQLQNLESKHSAQEQKLQDKHQQERQKQDSQQPKNKGDNKGDHSGHER